MCVIPCLFGALSRRVGAFQISISIIIIIPSLLILIISFHLGFLTDQRSLQPLPNDSYAGSVATVHTPGTDNSSDRWFTKRLWTHLP